MLNPTRSLCFGLFLAIGCYLTVIAFSSCRKTVETQMTPAQQEECAVYSVLLNSFYVRSDVNRLIIAQETGMDQLAKRSAREDLSNLDQAYPVYEVNENIHRLLTLNEQPLQLRDCFNLRVQTIFLNTEESGKVRAPGGWGGFFAKYPDQSLILLSRIAFNPEVTRALVYTSSESGGKSGQGSFVILAKKNNAWVIEHTIVSWKS